MKDFIQTYFPEYINNEAVQKEILRQFARPICGRYTTRTLNALFRSGICSIESLWRTSINWSEGSMTMNYIKEMKHEISRVLQSHDKPTL